MAAAVDEHAIEFDVLLQKLKRQNCSAALSPEVLRSIGVSGKIATGQLRSQPTANARIPKLAQIKHVFVRWP